MARPQTTDSRVHRDKHAVLAWQPPPKPIRQRTDWHEVARQLRGRPGAWAVVVRAPSPQAAGGMVSHLRGGRVIAMRPPADFEVVRRGQLVYARWVGHDGAAEDFDGWLPDPRCGTQAGARAHYRAGEPLCEACRLAQNRAGRSSA